MSERHKKLEDLLLRADWDDAPKRVRQGRSKHTRLWLSILVICIVFGAFANYIDSKQLFWQSNGALRIESPVIVRVSPTTLDNFQPAAISQPSKQQVDSYDEEVSLLAVPVERPSATEPKQTVFNDANYVPAARVNTVTMAAPNQSTAPRLNAAPRQGYVTVVQETKPSCWPFKPGSIHCRNYKKATKRAHNQNCYNSAHSNTEACRRAALYNPVQ